MKFSVQKYIDESRTGKNVNHVIYGFEIFAVKVVFRELYIFGSIIIRTSNKQSRSISQSLYYFLYLYEIRRV